MTPVEATAPGKVILFGEHAVVYGRPAIAAPVLNVAARVSVEPAAGAGLRIVATDLGRDYLLAEAEPDDPLAAAVRAVLDYLDRPVPPAALYISSTIPLGRGLGSGAAISTVIMRALARFFGRSLDPAEISSLVFEIEKLYHGTPSGIDNTVVAFAQPVYFIKGRPIQRLHAARPFTLVIGDTGLVSPTHRSVGDLRRRWQENPERYESYFDEIGAIARQARMAIEREETNSAAIGKLMNENQELLATIGVSSPELDRLVAAALRAGALGAKLSGAGWGGNMIALVRPETAAAVAAALAGAGASGVIVTEVS
jgi:mevalonate kinase